MRGKIFVRLPKRSPAALLVQSRTPQKSFRFLLPACRSLGAGEEEKNRRAQIRKSEENFFAGWRALASGGEAERQFRSKKFRAKFRISHQKTRLALAGWGNPWEFHPSGDLPKGRQISPSAQQSW